MHVDQKLLSSLCLDFLIYKIDTTYLELFWELNGAIHVTELVYSYLSLVVVVEGLVVVTVVAVRAIEGITEAMGRIWWEWIVSFLAVVGVVIVDYMHKKLPCLLCSEGLWIRKALISRTVQYKGVFKFSWTLLLGNKSLYSLKLGPWRVYFMSSTWITFTVQEHWQSDLKVYNNYLTISESQFRCGKSIKMERTMLTCMDFKEQVKASLLGQGALSSFNYILWAFLSFRQNRLISLFSVINCVV